MSHEWNGSQAKYAPILGEALARDEIKDPRVRGAGLITVTHVRVSGDLGTPARCSPCTAWTRLGWNGCGRASTTRAAISGMRSRAACG